MQAGIGKARWTTQVSGWNVWLTWASILFSCAPPPPPAPTAVRVSVVSETGTPVADAAIFAGPSLIARTDAEGKARLEVRGTEGESFSLRVQCPPAYRSPEQTLEVRRLDIVSSTTLPQYEVRCNKVRHTLVVAVRVENGPSLPVTYLGKEVARTDESGAAHVVLEMDVHDRAELVLRTAGTENDKVHPQNPSAVFEMPDHDDFQIFAMTFTRDAKKSPPVGGRPPGIKQF